MSQRLRQTPNLQYASWPWRVSIYTCTEYKYLPANANRTAIIHIKDSPSIAVQPQTKPKGPATPHRSPSSVIGSPHSRVQPTCMH